MGSSSDQDATRYRDEFCGDIIEIEEEGNDQGEGKGGNKEEGFPAKDRSIYLLQTKITGNRFDIQNESQIQP